MAFCNIKNMVQKKYGLALVLLTFLMVACRSSKEFIQEYGYFEKHGDTLKTLVKKLKEPVFQKNDQLSITVHSASLNQEQAAVFNVLNAQAGGAATGAATQGYLVDFDGNISMPVIGKVKVEGLTKTQLNNDLIKKIAPYVKDPVVNIRFLNFRVIMMGEVAAKGVQTFTNERATIVDAIAQAGGLTEMGKRSNILVFRENPDGTKKTDTLNINDVRIFGSDAYQLQQNDIVYVSPIPNKLKALNTNPTLYRDVPFIISLFSTLLLLVNLLFK